MNGDGFLDRRRLLVVRHAKSSWDDPSIVDHDRPLAPRGRKALPRLRAHLEGLGLHPDLVLCSSSLRTIETFEGIRPALGGGAHVKTEAELYGADSNGLLGRLRRIEDDVASVVLIGHNPGVADLTYTLVENGDPALDDPLVEKFPTAAAAALSFTGYWRNLEPSSAALDSFWTPHQPS